MSFFGLTALGPQDAFVESRRGASFLYVFSEEDWKAAFLQVSDGQDVIPVDHISSMLEKLYRGQPPQHDQDKFFAAVGSSLNHLSWTALMDIVSKFHCDSDMQPRNEAETSGSKTFCSNEEYRMAVKTQQGLAFGPRESQTRPLTAAQDYGWHHEGSEHVTIFGKKSCAETVYASELVKSGRFF